MGEQIYIQGASLPGEKTGSAGMLEYYCPEDSRSRVSGSADEPFFDPVLCKYDLMKITEGILRNAPSSVEDPMHRQSFWAQFHIRLEEIESYPEDEQPAFVRERVYDYLRDYENTYELTSLTKKDFSHVMENLFMIYNTDDREIRRVVQLIHSISQNVISEYIQIDGLERLFNEQYIDFEWEMHLGMDHNQQTMKFYRDHFIHQVRDAYMMDRLLRHGGFYERVYRVLSQPNASKVSQYFCKMVARQREEPLPNAAILQYDEEFIPRNIIYMSAYMAGLFHDIGYPDTYLQSLHRRISAFTPNMNPGNPMRDTLPGDLFSLLQNSLLFRVVPFEEIQTRVYQSSIDHGTLSAIAYLLQFYENGVIFRLPPYKAAAVELAALAIYNHTYVYAISGSGKKADDCRPRFSTNPISYLLRVCDDLQEWDRVYFEISSYSNLITCSHCHTPIVGQRRADPHTGSTVRRYVCNCFTQKEAAALKGHFSRTFDGALAFPYRRLYNVQVCSCVEVATRDGELKNAKDIFLRLRYDPYKLLHIAYISPSYARYRIEELNRLKPLLSHQLELPNMWLDYFVTANPILLKTRLLEEYFEGLTTRGKSARKKTANLLGTDDSSQLDAVVTSLMRLLVTFLNHWDDTGRGHISAKHAQYIRNEVKRGLRLYCLLYLYGKALRQEGMRPEKCLSQIVSTIRKDFPGPNEFQCLVGDCLLQLSRLYSDEQLLRGNCIPEEYLQQFAPGNWRQALTHRDESRCSKEFYNHAVEWYVDQQTYQPVCWFFDPNGTGVTAGMVDAFTDLGFFQQLYQEKS